jgi:hypothetical protein
VARKNEWQLKPTFFNPPKNLQTPRCFFELELIKKTQKTTDGNQAKVVVIITSEIFRVSL